MPTLVHDGAVIIDSSVICEFLDEVFPEVPMSMPRPAFEKTYYSGPRLTEIFDRAG